MDVNQNETDSPKPPADSPVQAPEVKPALTKRQKLVQLFNKRVLLIIGLAAIVITSGAAWALLRSEPVQESNNRAVNLPKSNLTSASDFNYAPRFTDIIDYEVAKDAEWYMVPSGVIRIKDGDDPAFYKESDGIPNGYPTSMAVYQGNLWVASHEGVVKLKDDQSGFELFQTGISYSNAYLYHDQADDVLYLSTFEHFYKLVDNFWQEVSNGPVNSYEIAANDNYLVSVGNTDPIWVYDKAQDKWFDRSPGQLADGVPFVFTIDGQIFVAGRDEYNSCADEGKVPATSAFKLNDEGNWEADTAFNSDLARPELNKSDRVKEKTDTYVYHTGRCSSDDPSMTYRVIFKDGTLQLVDGKEAPAGIGGFMGDDGTDDLIIAELTEKTGLFPMMRVINIDKNGNLIFHYADEANASSTPQVTGIGIAQGANLTKHKEVAWPTDDYYDVTAPIVCDGELKYVFAGLYEREKREGFAIGRWSKTVIYSLDNDLKATEFADIKNDLGEAVFACKGSNISWNGMDTVNVLSTGSKQIAAAEGELISSNALWRQTVQPLANGDMWISLLVEPRKENNSRVLYYFSLADNSVKKIADVTGDGLVGGTDQLAYMAGARVYETDYEAYDLLRTASKAGEVTTLSTTLFVRFGLVGANEAVLAAALTENQTVPYKLIKDGSESDIANDKSPVSKISLGYSSSFEGEDEYNTGVYDPINKTMWFSDDYIGSFAVKL